MRHLPLGLVILAGACGGKNPPVAPITSATGGGSAAPPPPSGALAPPTGFATADFVIATGGELATYAIEGGKAKPTSTVTLVKGVDEEQAILEGIGELEWTDRDHLFVKTAERAIVQVTAAAIAPVAIPAPATFKLPRPKMTDEQAADLEEGGAGGVNGGMIVNNGTLYWQECPWGFPYDGFQCEVHARAQLWPKPDLARKADLVTPSQWDWPAAVPAKFKTAIDPKTTRAVACFPASGKKTLISANADNESEQIESVHWISASPPRLVVLYGTPGYADIIPERWTMHDGCAPTPIAEGGTIETGPAGLWVSTDGNEGDHSTPVRRILRRGSEVIGEVPLKGNLRFRPVASPSGN